MSIHEKAWNGTLTETLLDSYVQSNPHAVNELDPEKGITPLMGATIRGHANIVDLLVNSGADVNRPSTKGLTALLYASWKTTRNRARIIQLLLEKDADVNTTCAEAEGNTPLMFIIQETRPVDIESIKELRKKGASLIAVNRQGKTANHMAKDTNDKKVIAALDPNSSNVDSIRVVDRVISFILFILTWVGLNSDNEVIRRMFNFISPVDPTINQAVNPTEPKTAKDFVANVDQYVMQHGLDKFFPKGSRFVEKLAQKAAELKKDPTTTLGSPENLPKVVQTSLYQQIIYCDDSSSMKHENRFTNLKSLVQRLAHITTQVLPEDEGVALRFINQDCSTKANLSEQGVQYIMTTMKQSDSGTQIGRSLQKKILEPLVYDKVHRGQFERPLLISVITDGAPTGEEDWEFQTAIVNVGNFLAEKGFPRDSVRFLIGQIGTAPEAERFLTQLKEEERISDVIYCTSDQLDVKYKEFKDNANKLDSWLVMTLFEPVKRSSVD